MVASDADAPGEADPPVARRPRASAARALAAVDPAAAAGVLGELAAKDPEPRLRRVAAELLAAPRAAVPR